MLQLPKRFTCSGDLSLRFRLVRPAHPYSNMWGVYRVSATSPQDRLRAPSYVAGAASVVWGPSWYAWMDEIWPVRIYARALRYRFRLPRRAPHQWRLMRYRPTKRVSVAPRVPYSTHKCWLPRESAWNQFQDTGANTPFSPFRAYVSPRRPLPRPSPASLSLHRPPTTSTHRLGLAVAQVWLDSICSRYCRQCRVPRHHHDECTYCAPHHEHVACPDRPEPPAVPLGCVPSPPSTGSTAEAISVLVATPPHRPLRPRV